MHFMLRLNTFVSGVLFLVGHIIKMNNKALTVAILTPLPSAYTLILNIYNGQRGNMVSIAFQHHKKY